MPPSDSRLPKYVYKQTVKGHTYYRFRRGRQIKRLPGSPGDAAFHAAYATLLAETAAPVGRYEPGSVAHTIHLYYQSADFSRLKPGTQRDYRRYLNRLDRSIGAHQIASVNESYIHSIIDELRNTPSAANHAVAVIRTLFRFALKRRIVSKDPTTGAGRLKGGDGYARWPDAAIATFLASASPAMRLALYLGLYTGQRLSDVIAMRWEAYDGKRIKLRQQKTGTPLVIPVHPDLRALLDPIRREAGPVLTSKTGLPFHSRVFSRDFRDARIAAGLPEGLSFHGLRHTAASRLAEVGATAPEIQAITGHKSLKLVEHYIRQADQELQAERAISRIPTREK